MNATHRDLVEFCNSSHHIISSTIYPGKLATLTMGSSMMHNYEQQCGQPENTMTRLSIPFIYRSQPKQRPVARNKTPASHVFQDRLISYSRPALVLQIDFDWLPTVRMPTAAPFLPDIITSTATLLMPMLRHLRRWTAEHGGEHRRSVRAPHGK